MVYKVADRVAETTQVVGLNPIVMLGAKIGFRSYSSAVTSGDLVDGENTYYCVVDQNNNWEVGYGIYTQSTQTITRNVLSSSTGSLVNFGIGLKDVFNTLPETAISELVAHLTNVSNPHGVTKTQVGLGNVDNTADADKPVSTAQATAIGAVNTALTTHTTDTANPHGVTQSQVGLGNVDNTSDINKPVSTAQAAAIGVVNTALTTHTSNTSNPHSVTKTQVGLGNVDNTADADKPVSTATQLALDGKAVKTGFPVDANGNYSCTLTYNETTRTVTVTPLAATFDVYVGGVKYTKTGAQSLAHTAAQGGHFIYYDATGTLVTSQTPWDLLSVAPVCFIFWDATNSRGIPFEERHHAGRDVYWHRNQHAAEGTKTTSGFGISGYTLNAGALDSSTTFSIASGRVEDEDIQVDTQVLPDDGPYTIMWRSGASGDWQIDRSKVRPYFDSANILQYNQNNAGTWQKSNVTEDFYVNYWVYTTTALPTTSITPAPTTTQQIIIIPGQNIFSSDSAAHSESPSNINWGNMPFQELAPLYQITLRYNALPSGQYTNTARTAITRVLRLIGSFATISQASAVDHGSLLGLSDLDHPASAIINTPSGTVSATNVQAAIDELDSEKASKTGVETLTNKTLTEPIITGQSAPAYAEGKIWYDTDQKALSYYNDVINTSMQIGYESWVRVRNVTGATITDGSVVVINGASGQTPTIALADADTHAPSQVIGVVTADILNNGVGNVTINGIVNNQNTSAYVDGDVLYLSQTPGQLTKIAPVHPASVVSVGIVAHAHLTQGKIYVSVNDAGDYEHAATVLTGKTFNLTDNTLTGTLAQFNTALSDGNFAIVGKTLLGVWPASAIRPQTTSGSAALAWDESTTNKVLFGNLAFDAATVEYAQFSFKTPQGLDETAGFTAIFEWTEASGATSHDCVWQIEMQAQADGATIDSAWGTAVTVTDTGSSGTRRFTAETATITPGGSWTPGAEIIVRISRLATSGSDTLNADAKLISVSLFATYNSSVE